VAFNVVQALCDSLAAGGVGASHEVRGDFAFGIKSKLTLNICKIKRKSLFIPKFGIK
jgi:hypothetical protein